MPRILKCLAFAFLICCVGCDGAYFYSYQGMLYQHDGHTPAANVPVELARTPHAPSNQPSPWGTTTDNNGRFKGEIFQETVWVLVLRPQAPKLQSAFLITPSTRPIEIDLSSTEQKVTEAGRVFTLPPITLPRNTGAVD